MEWSQEELERIGWTHSGDAMLKYQDHPDAWKAMVAYVKATIDPTKTTDTYMSVRISAFLEGYLAHEH